jgi:putative phage-type endonuclease
MNAPDRARFLGGSDIGAIVGVSRYKTALDVYMEKTGQSMVAPDPEREKFFRRGKRLEPVVLEMLLEERGIETLVRNERYVDHDHPFMSCEIDGEAIVDDEHVNIEVKTSHPFVAQAMWGDEGTDQIDVSYAAQAMWGLAITGRRRTIFGVLIGSDNLCTYEIVRDDETIAAMRAKAITFWNEHVVARVPPPAVNLPDVLKLFRKAPATTVEATAEVSALCDRLAWLKTSMQQIEDEEAEVKFQIGKFMLGEAGIALANGGKLEPTPQTKEGVHLLTRGGSPLLQVALQHQSRLDAARLSKERPEVVAEFQKPISFFTFAKPRGKRRV